MSNGSFTPGGPKGPPQLAQGHAGRLHAELTQPRSLARQHIDAGADDLADQGLPTAARYRTLLSAAAARFAQQEDPECVARYLELQAQLIRRGLLGAEDRPASAA